MGRGYERVWREKKEERTVDYVIISKLNNENRSGRGRRLSSNKEL